MIERPGGRDRATRTIRLHRDHQVDPAAWDRTLVEYEPRDVVRRNAATPAAKKARHAVKRFVRTSVFSMDTSSVDSEV
jgi:hypothetical protein